MSGVDDGFITTRDNARVAFTLHRCGVADAPRLALIHSLALDRSVWDGVVERLHDEVDLLTYDCRGHGASSKASGPYSTALFADDLADLLRAVGWTRALVAGASMGGCVTLEFVLAYSEMVDGVGLIDTTAWYGVDAPAEWAERAQRAQRDGLASLIPYQWNRWFTDAFRAAHPEALARYQRIFLANDVAAYQAACAMLGAFDARATLAAITVPAEIVVGEEDYATPVAMAEELERSIPGARLRVLAAARHLTPIEAPAAVAAALRELIAATRGSALEL